MVILFQGQFRDIRTIHISFLSVCHRHLQYIKQLTLVFCAIHVQHQLVDLGLVHNTHILD